MTTEDGLDQALAFLGLQERQLPPLVPPDGGLDRLVDLHRRAQDGGLFTFGFPNIDAQLAGGLAPGELCLVVGYANVGKTRFVMSCMVDQTIPVLWVTPDETAAMVSRDMLSMRTGLSPGEITVAIDMGDTMTMAMIREEATRLGTHLLIVDEVVDLDQLTELVGRASAHWQRPPAVMVFDYLHLLPHHPDRRGTLARQLKHWAKGQPFPTVCIHQSSRYAGTRGQDMELWSGNTEGEQEAIVLIGVSRPYDMPNSYTAADVVRVRLLKNKHTGRRVELSCTQDPMTGRISE